jgi:hypothetical protein
VFFDDRGGLARALVVGRCAYGGLLMSVRSRTVEALVGSEPTLVYRNGLLAATTEEPTGRDA